MITLDNSIIWFFGNNTKQGRKLRKRKPSSDRPMFMTADVTYAFNHSKNYLIHAVIMKPNFKQRILNFENRSIKSLQKELKLPTIVLESLKSSFVSFRTTSKDLAIVYEHMKNNTVGSMDIAHELRATGDILPYKGYGAKDYVDAVRQLSILFKNKDVCEDPTLLELELNNHILNNGYSGYYMIHHGSYPTLCLLGIDEMESISVRMLDPDVIQAMFGTEDDVVEFRYYLMNFKTPKKRARAFMDFYRQNYKIIKGKKSKI